MAPDTVAALAAPIQVESSAVNAPADAADAQTPLVLVAMLWIGSLTASLFGALALTTAVFFLIQSAVLNWLGFGGWPILVLLWLFSFTLLSVPAEALATGYRVLIHSWLPSRFPYEAIQGIVHFDGAGQARQMLAISAAIASGALALLLASYYRLRNRDLSINPIAERVANASNNDDTTPDTTQATDHTDDGDRRPTPA